MLNRKALLKISLVARSANRLRFAKANGFSDCALNLVLQGKLRSERIEAAIDQEIRDGMNVLFSEYKQLHSHPNKSYGGSR
jgi:hypothetical protein